MKLRLICKANKAALAPECSWPTTTYRHIMAIAIRNGGSMARLTTTPAVRLYGIIIFTQPMPTDPQAKRKALQATGTFNPRATHVRHTLFDQSAFFDPEDLLQLKYETLRALEVERCPIAKAAREFGLSRPTIYEAQTQLEQHGLEGLLPRKRGPKAAHKLTDEVRDYLQEQTAAQPGIQAGELARRLRQRYALKVHPRTIQKALKAKAKKGRQT